MWEAIEKGDYPQWDLGVQVFDEDFADQFDFDVLDATKLIPEELVPVRIIGTMTLNRMPENFFFETEQVAFQTGNIVPGIDHSNDPLLQGRNFSYLDTQLKRLGGPNFNHIPVNAPKCPFAHLQQDGHMAMHNPRGRANYEPNSWGEGPREDPERGFRSYEAPEDGTKQRVRSETFADHYSQARQFYLSQTAVEQDHIADAFTFELSKVERLAIRQRMVGHLRLVDEALAQSVAEGLGLESLPEAPEPARAVVETAVSDKLSILKNAPDSFAGRKLGVLLTDGIAAEDFETLKAAGEAAGATVEVVAEKVGGVTCADGRKIAADEKLDGAPSVLYDAVAVIASEEGAGKLAGMHGARSWLADAHAHLKFIALSAPAKAGFWPKAVPADPDAGVFDLSGQGEAEAFLKACGKLRLWDRAA
jgi:catalase